MIPDVKDPAFMSALSFFDCAARHLSFSRAAAELGVTPSAVSHRIAALERALEQRLFIRETRSVRLTPEGAELAQATQPMLDELDAIAKRITGRNVLRVSAGPSLSALWLLRRLNHFEDSIGNLRIDLVHAVGPVDPRTVDVSILWARATPPPANATLLFDTHYVPVTAPPAETTPFWETSALPLHFRDRKPWRHWLGAAGAPLSYADKGEIFDDPNLVIEAAAQGRGIAIGILPLAQPLIDSGRLTIAHHTVVDPNMRFWILTTDQRNELSSSFKAWLIDQAAV